MRPDFEVVIAKVLDHIHQVAATHPDFWLDTNRIAAVGVSMGGYFALRSSLDPRIRACVSIDPFYGLWRLALTRMPRWYANLWTSGWLPEGVFDALVYLQMKLHFPTWWEFQLGMAIMGTSTPGDTLRRFQLFDLDIALDNKGKVVDRIQCPVLVTGASTTIYASADESTAAIYKSLSRVPEGHKEIWIPQEIGCGGLTAKIGAWSLMAQRTYEFLDRHFKVARGSSDKAHQKPGAP